MQNKIKVLRWVNEEHKDKKRDTLTIHSVIALPEAARAWKKDAPVLNRVITKGGKFLKGVDWTKSGNAILVTVESMFRIYGDPEDVRQLQRGVMSQEYEDELGIMKDLA